MEFLLLGHLMVRRDGDLVPIPRGKQRTVLAALLLQANRVVTIDDLARALWDGGRPRDHTELREAVAPGPGRR